MNSWKGYDKYRDINMYKKDNKRKSIKIEFVQRNTIHKLLEVMMIDEPINVKKKRDKWPPLEREFHEVDNQYWVPALWFCYEGYIEETYVEGEAGRSDKLVEPLAVLVRCKDNVLNPLHDVWAVHRLFEGVLSLLVDMHRAWTGDKLIIMDPNHVYREKCKFPINLKQ